MISGVAASLSVGAKSPPDRGQRAAYALKQGSVRWFFEPPTSQRRWKSRRRGRMIVGGWADGGDAVYRSIRSSLQEDGRRIVEVLIVRSTDA